MAEAIFVPGARPGSDLRLVPRRVTFRNTLELRRALYKPSSRVEELRVLDPEGRGVPLGTLARESYLSGREFERAFKERFRTSRRPFLEDR